MGGSRTLGWIAAIGAFLLLGWSVAITAIEEPAPARETVAPAMLYDREDRCEEPCHAAAASDTFSVTEGLVELHFVVYAVLDASSGPAYVTVTDPSGDVRYERLFSNEAWRASGSAAIQDAATWRAELGDWTLTRSYVGVSGLLDLQAWGESGL